MMAQVFGHLPPTGDLEAAHASSLQSGPILANDASGERVPAHVRPLSVTPSNELILK